MHSLVSTRQQNYYEATHDKFGDLFLIGAYLVLQFFLVFIQMLDITKLAMLSLQDGNLLCGSLERGLFDSHNKENMTIWARADLGGVDIFLDFGQTTLGLGDLLNLLP
jgi:hypothetical protein